MHCAPLTAGAAACLLAVSTGASAEIAAEDVWSNMTAYFGALGADLTANLSRSGDVTTADGLVARFALPMEAGSFVIAMGSLRLAENRDGTVTIRYPEELPILAELGLNDGSKANLGVTLFSAGYVTTASGEPGDVTYDYVAESYWFVFTGLDLEGEAFENPGLDELRLLDITGDVSVTGSQGRFRVTEGDLLTVEFSGGTGEVTYQLATTGAEVVRTDMVGRADGGTSTFNAAIPAGGVSLLNLAAALRDGLSITASGAYTGIASEQRSTLDGELAMYQRTATGRSQSDLVFDEAGLRMNGTASDYSVDVGALPGLPFPISATIDSAAGSFAVPLLQSEAPQQVAIRMDLNGLRMGEDIWGLFDPTDALPRDAAALELDLSADIRPMIDFLDIEALASLGPTDAPPVELHGLTLTGFLLSLAGTELTARGGFAFDNTDMATFGGMPAVDGKVELELVGANGLMDTLVEMGLLPEDQAMSARMMLGLFARPGDGLDTLVSTIEVKPDGSVLANGQRVK